MHKFKSSDNCLLPKEHFLRPIVVLAFLWFGCYCFVFSNQASNKTDELDNQQSRKRRDTENKMLVSSKNLNHGVLAKNKITFRRKKTWK